MSAVLKDAVLQASQRAEVCQAVAAVYAGLQSQIDARRPICNTSGRCCRFEEFGHRLYVTTAELAAFVADLQQQAGPWDGTGCPFQTNGLCTVHSIRPFGCRVFFCDASSTQWQQDQYERFHSELKRVHETLGVEYHYVEWRFALLELGLAEVAPEMAQPGKEQKISLSLPQLRL